MTASSATSNDKKQIEEEEKKDQNDPEKASINPNLPYPKQIAFIVANEFCERFSYYGMRTILSIYMTDFLNYSEPIAATFFHVFAMFCYFTPVIGAIIADSFLGKFKTIFYISIIYAIGQIVLTFGSIDPDKETLAKVLSFTGLGLIAFGTGGIKPCVVSFGAEQFKLPDQEDKMKNYFSLFYASINAGSLISTFLTPILRDKECAGQDTCFPAAFGVPAALMIIAIVFFMLGRIFNMYKMTMPEENIIVKFCSCIWHSFKESRRLKKHNKDKSMGMLDYGAERFGKSFVEDVRAVLNVLYMFIPFPIFWALFDQQGSLWTFQARNMNGVIAGDFKLLPDQLQIVNPFLILAFIPVFEYGIYPLFGKFGMLKTPLQRIVTGGLLAGLSFVVSGFVELSLEQYYPDLPDSGFTHMSIYNGLPPQCVENLPVLKLHYKPDGSESMTMDIKFDEDNEFLHHEFNIEKGQYSIDSFVVDCKGLKIQFDGNNSFGALEGLDEDTVPNLSILITYDLEEPTQGLINVGTYTTPLKKTKDGKADVKMLWNVDDSISDDGNTFEIVDKKENVASINITSEIGDSEIFHMEKMFEHNITLKLSNETIKLGEKKMKFGANYVFVYVDHPKDISENATFFAHKITEHNHLHMAFALPQFAIMTAGEVMFSITGLQFAFSQAPDSMRAILQSAYTVTTGLGNLIDVILISTLTELLPSRAYLFFMFAGLMAVDMALLAFMAMRYKYVNYTGKEAKD